MRAFQGAVQGVRADALAAPPSSRPQSLVSSSASTQEWHPLRLPRVVFRVRDSGW